MMKRRSFLKKTATAGLITWITPSALVTVLKANTITPSELSFEDPGTEYAPYTWWHWMNGNISKEGITLDLEAMSNIGLGGFQMFEVGTGIPKGPISYLSEEWLEMVAHTINECKRLGLEFAMHNCPGWSSSGGPWITPELGMQQLTWSETTISGGKQFKGFLAEPIKNLNYYKDSITIAFPALTGEKKPWTTIIKDIQFNNQPIDFSLMNADGQFKEPLMLGKSGSDSFIDFIFTEPYQLRSLTMLSSGNNKLMIQRANINEEFETIKQLTDENQGNANANPSYITSNFDNVLASHYRLTFRGVLKISMLCLSKTGRIENWLSKANFPSSRPTSQSSNTETLETDVIDSTSVIDLTSMLLPNGQLEWDVPHGEWTILRLGHTAIGRMNKSAPSTGTGLDCDKFSKVAFDFHWEHVFKNILPLLTSLSDTKIGFLIDSYEMGLQNWSATFPEEFQKRKQYSLAPYLPALTGRIIDSVDTTERFLRDFRQAQADVMAENYYGRFAERCRAKGITSYTEPYEGGNFEEIKIGRAVDVSMGEFWAGHTMLYNNSVLDRTMKVASSIAHSKGQSIVGAEAFTAEPGSGKWQQYPFSMKSLGDFMFTKGLTRIIFHRYAHQPHPTALPGMTMGPWGIHFDRTNTWFSKSKEWIKYLTRCQYMLRRGSFVADIAYYVGEEVPGRTINPEQTKWAAPIGYDYDLINTDCLIDECQMKNGRLENLHGVSYKVLILPDIETISIRVLKKLEVLLMDGLILIGKKPNRSFGVKDRLVDKEFNVLVDKIWNNTGKLGKGKIFQHSNIKKILLEIGIEPDFEYTSSVTDPAINFIHRKETDLDIYFVANRRRRQENIICSFRITDRCPELWDPLTGKITQIAFYTVQYNKTLVPLLLEPSGSAFIVFRKKANRLKYKALYLDQNPIINTEKFAQKSRGIHRKTFGDFTVTCWIKPEIDISLREDGFYGDRRTNNYVIYPVAGEQYYGKGHVGSGFTVGRNGVALFERANEFIQAVLFAEVPISGWSHLTIVYEKNIPSVYLNNELIKTGTASAHIVHPSVGEAYQDDHASYYDGDLIGLELIGSALIPEAALILPPTNFTINPTIQMENEKICFWKNGSYMLKNNLGKVQRFDVTQLPEAKQLKGNWTIKFPGQQSAPKQIHMDELIPLQKHAEDGVRYFSGTAEYLTDFTFTVPNYAYQIKLDLGRVEVLAEVNVNGKTFPALWSQPYILDITSAVRNGINKLSIKVTNLWPNRLIGDEQLPEENEYAIPASNSKLGIGGAGGIKKLPDWYAKGIDKPSGERITFSTWKHYHKGSPLLESGLLGPVNILIGILKDTLT